VKPGLLELLSAGTVLLCDGAMGSMLMAAGLEPGTAAELFNIEKPDTVRNIHTENKKAGADVLITNTFQGTRFNLARYGKNTVQEANSAAAEIALQVAGEDCLVLGDIGPTGHFLHPLGEATGDDFRRAFAEQIQALAAAGVHGIIIETMEDKEEISIANETARQAAPGLPVVASMTFKQDVGRDDYHTMMGVSIHAAVRAMAEAGADVIGSNCGNGPKEMIGIIQRMSESTSLPIIAEPNAGMPRLKDGKQVYDLSQEDMAQYVEPLITAGVSILGGCCGTTPRHIASMARELRRIGKRR
jgi:5-methyltetrahydrofolate--homocysteine methyltransferase